MSETLMRDMRLACGEKGNGIPMVFLHGTAGDRTHWSKLLAELAALNVPVRGILPELYGYGASPAWSLDRDVTIADHAAAVIQAVENLAQPFVMVAHSLGGAVALRMALERPGMFSRLILIEPAAFHALRTGSKADEALLEDLAIVGRQLASAGRQSDPAVTAITTGMFVDYWNGTGVWQGLPDAMKDGFSRRLPSIGSDFSSLYAVDMPVDRYAEIDVPVLILRGGRSPQPTRRIAELLTETIPHAGMIEIADSGHMMPLSHAARLAAHIRDELALERV
ncbi:MAG: alpha/beta hydrolase [Ferrovibrio sp.]